MGGVIIVWPPDWASVNSAALDVIVGEFDEVDFRNGEFACVVWHASDYFSEERTKVLARAELRRVEGRLGRARFECLRPWGKCVIGVVPERSLDALAVSGVMLDDHRFSRWSSKGDTAAHQNGQPRFPLPAVDCPWSFVAGDAHEGIEVVQSLPELMAPQASAGPAVRVLPLAEAQVIDAGPTLKYAVCLSSDVTRHNALLAQANYDADVPYAAMMRDVEVVFPSGAVLPEANRLWSDSTLGAFWLDPMLTHSPGLFRLGGRVGRAPGSSRTLEDLLTVNGRRAARGVPLIGFGKACNNYMHWLTNSVFSAWLLADELREGRLQMLVPDLSPLTLASLAAIGVGGESLLIAPPGQYRFDRAVFPSPLSTLSNRRPPRLMADFFRALASATDMAQCYRPPPRRIYVTREGAPSMRIMTNEAELVAALVERDFNVVAPHELDFVDEVYAFSAARVVIGQLGAGLCNIGFSPPGCRVVEIATHNYGANDFWYLCGLMGHGFSRITVDAQDNDDEFSTRPFEFEVPLGPTLALLDAVLAEI